VVQKSLAHLDVATLVVTIHGLCLLRGLKSPLTATSITDVTVGWKLPAFDQHAAPLDAAIVQAQDTAFYRVGPQVRNKTSVC
jgi:hypothetical protein